MTDRRVLANLRITPCGLVDPVTRTFTLQRVGTAYSLVVVERNGLTKTRSHWRVPVDASAAQEQFDALKQAMIPAFPISPTVLDGEYLELTVEGKFCKLTLSWWTITPTGAECLSEFAEWLRETGLGGK